MSNHNPLADLVKLEEMCRKHGELLEGLPCTVPNNEDIQHSYGDIHVQTAMIIDRLIAANKEDA